MSDRAEGMVQDDKSGTLYRFYYDTAENSKASNVFGRTIHDELLMVEIITPGQRNSTPSYELKRIWSQESKSALGLSDDFRASEKYAELRPWVQKYETDNPGLDISGTRLTDWPRIGRALAATLAGSGIYTVEQVANIPDNVLDVLGMGGRELRETAKAYLADAGIGSDSGALATRVAELEREVSEYRSQIASQNELLRGYAERDKADAHSATAATGLTPPAFAGVDGQPLI